MGRRSASAHLSCFALDSKAGRSPRDAAISHRSPKYSYNCGSIHELALQSRLMRHIGSTRMAKPTQLPAAEIVICLRRGENPIDVARRFGLSLVNLAGIAEENGLILSAERFHVTNLSRLVGLRADGPRHARIEVRHIHGTRIRTGSNRDVTSP
jgi:hypothetical protein